MTNEEMTVMELRWLRTRGGRTSVDVSIDEIGKYVLMGNRYMEGMKVYIPSQKELVEMFQIKS